MGLDIRIPLGLIFLIIGGIMSLYGFLTRSSGIYERSLGLNLNLGWGLIMFVFGLVMFFVGPPPEVAGRPGEPTAVGEGIADPPGALTRCLRSEYLSTRPPPTPTTRRITWSRATRRTASSQRRTTTS